MNSHQKLEAELTLRAGRIVWDLNGISMEEFEGSALTSHQ